MLRKVLLITFTITVLVVAGFKLYATVTNTVDRHATSFTQALADGNVDKAYSYLTEDARTGKQAYWREYFAAFRQTESPILKGQDAVDDSFNTYTDGTVPTRFTYLFKKDAKPYQMIILMIREAGKWKVDQVFGDITADPPK